VGKLNPEHVSALYEMVNASPYFRLMSMRVREVSDGYARIEVDLDEKHLNLFGIVHGGVYASLIDSAAWLAVYSDLPEDAGLTTLDIKVDNLSSVKAGHLVVEGKRIKAGRSTCLAEASVVDAHGKYLAHGTSKLMVLSSRQSFAHAVATMGYAPLPPKFVDDNQES
jgi:uncharacterized protein (TIGR00369 family)